MGRKVGVLLLAHGAAASVEEIPAYLQSIFGERPVSKDLILDIQERYRLIDGKSPLVELTRAQARGLQTTLRAAAATRSDLEFEVRIGMRHSSPTILSAIESFARFKPEYIVAVPLTPYFSRLSVGAYKKKLEQTLLESGVSWEVSWVESWNEHPLLIEAFVSKIRAAQKQLPAPLRQAATVVFSAHSLPKKILAEKDPYPTQVEATARAVAQAASLTQWRLAYQSRGAGSARAQPWLGPEVGDVLRELSHQGAKATILAPIGFLSDHLETLYDEDILYRKQAQSLDLAFVRAQALNDDPLLIRALADRVLSKTRRSCATEKNPWPA